MSKCIRKCNRAHERSMQYTVAVLEIANGLQFRQWSSRGKGHDFPPLRGRWSPTLSRSRMTVVSPLSPLSPAHFRASRRGEGAREGNTFSRYLHDCSRALKDGPTCSSRSPCLSSLARPHWNVSISKLSVPHFIHSASSHIGSSRVSQTSFARSLIRSLLKTAKSPSP